MLELLLNILLSFTPLGKLVDWGMFLFVKAIAAAIRQLILSVAIVARRDKDPQDVEAWLESVLYSTTLDEDEVDMKPAAYVVYQQKQAEEANDYKVVYDEEEEETGDEEYLQYGHVDDMD